MGVDKLNKQTKTLFIYEHRTGFSYIEVLLTAIIIGILLVAALRLFGNIGRSRHALTEHDGAEFLALQMIEEIKPLPYRDPVFVDEFGPGGDETGSRSAFDDIDDYHNWSACPPQDRDGSPLGTYDDLTRSVTVRYLAADDFQQPVAGDEGFKEVTVTINRNGETLARQVYVLADCLGDSELAGAASTHGEATTSSNPKIPTAVKEKLLSR